MKNFSKKQEILNFIINFLQLKGYSPSLDEIGEGVGTTKSNVFRYLKLMEADGLINRVPGSSRAIEVVGERKSTDEVIVVSYQHELPSVIIWQGRRYVIDSTG